MASAMHVEKIKGASDEGRREHQEIIARVRPPNRKEIKSERGQEQSGEPRRTHRPISGAAPEIDAPPNENQAKAKQVEPRPRGEPRRTHRPISGAAPEIDAPPNESQGSTEQVEPRPRGEIDVIGQQFGKP